MNARYLGILAFAAGLLVPAAVFAQPMAPVAPADSAALVKKLQKQERMDEFKAKFWSQEPLTQQDYDVQEKEDQRLIAEISAGEPVSPGEIEQALKRIDTDY
jgi:hypothetical protein